MSTKKSHKQHKSVDKLNELEAPQSVVHVLENAVLAIEASGCDETYIFSLVNMILKGFIRNGQITEEYMDLAQQAVKSRQEVAQQFGSSLGSDSSSGFLDAYGNKL